MRPARLGALLLLAAGCTGLRAFSGGSLVEPAGATVPTPVARLRSLPELLRQRPAPAPGINVPLPQPAPRAVAVAPPPVAIEPPPVVPEPVPPPPALPVPPDPAAGPPAADVGMPPRSSAPRVPAASAPAVRQSLLPQRELRRDPIEPPLTDPDAWQELLLQVTLNGREVSQGSLFAERAGTLAVQLATLKLWRVELDEGGVITFQGEPYYPLNAIPGAVWNVDRDALAIRLDIPAERFAATRLAGQDREPLPPPGIGKGGFLDYDLLLSGGDGLDLRLDGLLEAGAFSPLGTLVSSMRLGELGPGVEATRLDTTFTRDLPERRASLRLGDSLTGGGALAAPVRFAGVQYASNFATDPGFVTFPLPLIGGLAEQDSVVDVLIDNFTRIGGEVPPGPFQVDSLPVVTGAGEVQLRVTDLLGRERVVTQPYYVSSRLLKAGLSDFSYELGFEREDYAEKSFAYGEPLASATHRRGLTDRLSVEGHLEVEPDLVSAAAGASTQLGRLGVVTTALGASAGDEGNGAMLELGYEYDGRPFSFAARSRFASEDFRQIGEEGGSRTDTLSAGLDLGRFGRFGLLGLNRESEEGSDVTSLALSYSHLLGPGSLSLRAAEVVRPEDAFAVTLTYALPLGPTRSLSTELEVEDGDRRARTQLRQTRGASDLGLDYRVGAEAGDRGLGADARLSYQTRVGAADLEVERRDGEDRLRTGVNGSVALVDGHAALSRRVGRAFGMVVLPGFPDVRVYLDNRAAGRTAADGTLLLPGLRPYEANRVRLEVEDLPLDTRLRRPEVVANPGERAGMTIGFDLQHSRSATAILRAEGAPLPAGLVLLSADKAVRVQVARAGLAQIEGLGGAVTVSGEAGARAYSCDLPAAVGEELMPDLGELACR